MADEEKQDEVSNKWVFPPRRCPRCKTFNSIATHTDSVRGIQYRRCRTPLCQATKVRFSVKGVAVESQVDDPVDESASFTCPHCQMAYKRRGDLTKHLNKVHGVPVAPEKGDSTDGREE
ncbi:hypothetical protein M0R72_14430 [Candidatus Pacearchaeota archaeon]|jgi:uncharacterized C2H2 Zn-finger protein|nr:hypothetical protein [Candidatus Pacearchaeota archaeon]